MNNFPTQALEPQAISKTYAKREAERRTKTISLRITPEQYEFINEQAEQTGQTMSVILQGLIDSLKSGRV